MCISHEFRRRGLGLRLIQHCLSFAKEQGNVCVFLTTPAVNVGALSTYTKEDGFTRDAEDLEHSLPDIGVENQ